MELKKKKRKRERREQTGRAAAHNIGYYSRVVPCACFSLSVSCIVIRAQEQGRRTIQKTGKRNKGVETESQGVFAFDELSFFFYLVFFLLVGFALKVKARAPIFLMCVCMCVYEHGRETC